MKKRWTALVLSLSLLLTAAVIVPASAAAAPAVDNKLIWVGDDTDPNWEGINLTVVDGKTNTTKRLFKGDVRGMAVSGDWIYFLKQDPDADVIVGNIMKMKKDGSALSEVTKGNEVQQFTLDGKVFYYGGYDKEYNLQFDTMNLDGSGKKVLNPNLPYWSYLTGKGYIFYVDTAGDSRLYRTALDGKAKTAISTGEVAPRDGGYALYGDMLFYAEKGKTEKDPVKWSLSDVTGKNKKTFSTTGWVAPINYLNKQFFYEETVTNAAKKEVRTLTRINRDGTAKKALTVLAADDRYIGMVGSNLVYKTPAGKVYQIDQAGKVLKAAK